MSEKTEKDQMVDQVTQGMPSGNHRNSYADDTIEIDLAAFFKVLKKKILVIILVAVLGAGCMGAYSFFVATPMYSSTAKLYVLSQSTSITSLADIQLSSELAQDYTEMIFSYPVVRQVINNLDLDYSYKQVTEGDMVEVENPADTRVIKVEVTSDDPEEAAAMANEFANVAKRTIAEIMESDEPKIFEHGRVSTNPVSPDKKKNMALGFLAGALLVIVILFIRFALRDVIRTTEDVQNRLNGNVLASIPMEKPEEKTKIALKGGKNK